MVALRARTALDNPGKAIARIIGVGLPARAYRVLSAPPEKLQRPAFGQPLVQGGFVEVDRTLDARGELLYAGMDVREPFDGLRNETVFFVRRGEYALITAEVQVGWIPAAYPLRKDCYTLQKGEDGVVSVESTKDRGCRLTTSAVSSTVSLWGMPGDAHAR